MGLILNTNTNMKNNFWHLLMLAVLSLTATCLVACSSSSDDEPTPTPQPQPQPVKGTFTLNVNASLSGAATRGTLTEDGTAYKLYWTAEDRVDVKKDVASVGTLSASTTGTASSDLVGTVSGTFEVDDELTLTYPKAAVSYTGQKGTLADIGANYAFATATVTVATVSESVITTGDAAFAAQHAIVKFTLKDEKGVAINATSLTIKGCGQAVSVTLSPESAASELYVSVPAIANKNLTLTASTGSAEYKYNRTNVTFAAGKHYTQNVTMGMYDGSYNANSTPLTFQAIKEGTITYTAANAGYTVEYKKNNGGWTTYSSAISVAVGDVVSFRGTNATYYVSIGEGTGDLSTFVCSSACYIYGNVMSLISKESFSSTVLFTAVKAFLRMFKNQANLRSHPYKDLVLPATTLAEQCYQDMFSGCTGLTRSAILANATGAANAYQRMYNGCSNLSEVTCNAAYNAAYFADWLKGVASSGTFYTNKDSWSDWVKNNISGWTVK